MKAETKKTVKRLLLAFFIILAVVLVGYAVMYLLGITHLDREAISSFVEKAGVLGPIIYIGISFLQVTFIPIPAAITILAGNYVFGVVFAFLYSYIGCMLGSVLAFALGKLIGRRFVNWVSGGQEVTDSWISKLKDRETVLLFFMFLFPLFPDDILCSVAGILPISWASFMVMQAITRATSIGATLLFMSGEFIPYEGWGLVVLGVTGVLLLFFFIICFKHADKFNVWYERFVVKLCRAFGRKKRTK